MSKQKVLSEQNMKQNVITLARQNGVEEKVKKIIQKTEDAIKNVKTEYERKHIAHMGLIEIHKTIGCVGALVVDGIELLPENHSYQEAIDLTKKCVRLD